MLEENQQIYDNLMRKINSTKEEISERQKELIKEILDPKRIMTKDKIPEEFYCPLTKEMLNVPVVNQYGHSYEEAKYRAYIKVSKNDPVTGKEVKNFELYVNYGLIDAIEDFLLK